MTEFKCLHYALYRGSQVLIVGKRYGHKENINVGRMYDVRMGSRTFTDVPEKELKPVLVEVGKDANTQSKQEA